MNHPGDCESCALRQKIQVVLASDRPPFEKLRAVELALHPAPLAIPIDRDPKGWPLLGTPWERHDDPEMPR